MKGYRVTMRKDTRTGEHLAVVSDAYRNRDGGRYYMAVCESNGCWTALQPDYLTRCTRTAADYPQWLKRRCDTSLGYIMQLSTRLYG